MFRRANVRLAKPLGVPSPSLTTAIQTSRTLSRILGGSKARQLPLSILDSAVSKTNGQGIAGIAALISRATGILNRPLALGAVDTALEDIKTAIEASKNGRSTQEKLLHRLALALRLRAYNTLLDEKEHLMSIHGAGNEAEVSDARGLVRESFLALQSVAPNDPFILLGLGEFDLYEGRPKQAIDKFNTAEASLAIEIPLSNKLASLENNSAAAIVAFKLTTSLPAVSTAAVKDPVVLETLTTLAEKPVLTAEENAAIRAELGAPESLTDQEIILLAVTLDNAEKGHHYCDFFPMSDKYKTWPSEKSQKIVHAVESFMFGKGVSMPDEELDAIRATKPAYPFYASATQLKALLEQKEYKSGDLFTELIETFGEGPTSQLSTDDSTFWNAVTRLKSENVCNFSGGSTIAVGQQSELIEGLLQQIRYRLHVSKALALDRINEPYEALKLLDNVVAANEYVFMWKALLARGRVRQNLGMINESDADFKALFALRNPYTGADIPLRDENRSKSVF